MKEKKKYLHKSGLPMRAQLVYRYLEDRMNEQHECWPSLNTISKDLNLSIPTVTRALKDLYDESYIEKKKRFRTNGGCTSNLYIIK